MLYNEVFYPIHQPQNHLLTVRQCGVLKQDKSYKIERSNSKTNVIAYVETGCLHVKTEKIKFSVGEKQSVLLPNNTKYTIYADPKNPPLMYWLNIRGMVFDSVLASMQLEVMCCACPFLDLFEKITALAAKTENHFDEIAQNVFALLLRLRSSQLKKSNDQTEERPEVLLEAYICNHIQDGFSLQKMAKELHLSADAIRRQFQKYYGVAPYQYYQQMRIDFAKHMLSQSEITIEDIAKRLNFTDRNYFSLYFKQKTGISPAAYRKAQRQM